MTSGGAGFQQSVSLIFPQACDALEGAVLGLKAGEVKMAGTEPGAEYFRRCKTF